MIKKILKIIGISLLIGFIGLIILGTIANIILIPDRKKSKTDQEMYAMANRLKKECPVQVGAYMYLTNVSFFNDTIRYDYLFDYNENIVNYFHENTDVIKNLTTLLFVTNEHFGFNSKWANLLKENDYIWQQYITIKNQDNISITYNGEELNSALKELTSKEALQSYLDATLFLWNEFTPIIFTEDGDMINDIEITQNTEKEYQLLNKIHLREKDIIFDFTVPEIEITISDLKKNCESPDAPEILLKELCIDEEFKGGLKIFALAKCNLVLRYYGVKSKQSIDITIPYSMIRQHTYIPSELLEVE